MKQEKNICIVGLGLIGGSVAKACRALGSFGRIIGVDASEEHGNQALKLNLVDDVLNLEEAIEVSHIVVLATPVNHIETLLPVVLDCINHQAVFDVGSTKENIIQAVKHHPKRGRYVACHPMAGTEFSGPSAAIDHLFKDCYNVICDAEESDKDALELVEQLLTRMGMKLIYQKVMDIETKLF